MSVSAQMHSVTRRVVREFGSSTNLSLWLALFGLEYNIIVGTEIKFAAFTLERRQGSTVSTFGPTGPFQLEPDSESNSGTKLGASLAELANVPVTGFSSFGVIPSWRRREYRICICMGSLEAGRYRLDLTSRISNWGTYFGTTTDMVSLMTWINSLSGLG